MHPELLRLVPERWQRNPHVLRILSGAVCLLLAAETASAEVAPLFVHGEGRGAFGCIAVNPPVFLSEAEARQVIVEEAGKAGLKFEPDALTIPGATLPVTNLYWCGGEPGPLETRKGKLVLDGFDRKHNVAFEFVSDEDVADWKNRHPRCASSVSVYDVRGAATTLRDGLPSGKDAPQIGIFYEPASPKGHGAKELRAQVRDFIAWLKAQGVI